MSKNLAINGGGKSIEEFKNELCVWPIITDEDREAIVGVLDNCAMSGTEITVKV